MGEMYPPTTADYAAHHAYGALQREADLRALLEIAVGRIALLEARVYKLELESAKTG